MFILAIIIYIVLAVCLGPLWPIEMFFRGGILGMIISGAWWWLFIGGLA